MTSLSPITFKVTLLLVALSDQQSCSRFWPSVAICKVTCSLRWRAGLKQVNLHQMGSILILPLEWGIENPKVYRFSIRRIVLPNIESYFDLARGQVVNAQVVIESLLLHTLLSKQHLARILTDGAHKEFHTLLLVKSLPYVTRML